MSAVPGRSATKERRAISSIELALPGRPSALRQTARAGWLAGAALGAGALAIRLFGAGFQSLRLDEAQSIQFAALPLWGRGPAGQNLLEATAADFHPPAYLVLLHVWLPVAGSNLALLRLPAVLAGALAVPVLYLLTDLLYERRVALLAAALAAVSPFWIWHSQEVRMYSLLLLTSVLGSYGLALAVLRGRSAGLLLWFAASLLGVYTQYFAFLVLAAQSIWFLFSGTAESRRLRVRFLSLGALLALSYVPWLAMLALHHHSGADPQLTRPGYYTVLLLIVEFVFGYLPVPVASQLIGAWPLLVLLALGLGTFGAGISRGRGLLLAAWLSVPVGVSIGVSLVYQPLLTERYLIVVTPPLLILIALLLVRLSPPRTLAPAAAALVTLMAAGWVMEEMSPANPAAEDYRSVSAFIDSHAVPGDAVGLDASFSEFPYFFYAHDNLPAYELPYPAGSAGRPALSDAYLDRYLSGVVAGRSHLWVVYELEAQDDPGRAVRAYLEKHSLSQEVIFGGPGGQGRGTDWDSYRPVQLVVYTFQPGQPGQVVRPLSAQDLRYLTGQSPSLSTPFVGPRGRDGASAALFGAPLAAPAPDRAWYLPTPATAPREAAIDVFNTEPRDLAGSLVYHSWNGLATLPVKIPAASELEVRLGSLDEAAPGGAVRFSADGFVVVRRQTLGESASIEYGRRLPEGELDTPAGLPLSGAIAAPSPGTRFWGAYVSGLPGQPAALDHLVQVAGSTPSIAMWFQSWDGQPMFDSDLAASLHARGIVPMITWEPWKPVNFTTIADIEQPDYSLARIAGGAFDAYVTRYAQAVRAYGGPVMLRPFHEMDGFWYPWGGLVNGNRPSDLVDAWRHVHDIFSRVGAANVTWVWSVNNIPVPDSPENGLDRYWPGSDYVDWIGLSGFNWGDSSAYSLWTPFRAVFQKRYDELKGYGKPIAITEVGVAELGGDKAAWIRDAAKALTDLPAVGAVIWYDQKDTPERDWTVDSSPAAAAAFRELAQQSSTLGAPAALESAPPS